MFKKNFWYIFILLICAEIFSFYSWWLPSLNTVIFCFTLALTGYLSFKDLKFGLYIALAEIFIGSKGYLFFVDIGGFRLSLRIALFCLLFMIFVVKEITLRAKERPMLLMVMEKILKLKPFLNNTFLLKFKDKYQKHLKALVARFGESKISFWSYNLRNDYLLLGAVILWGIIFALLLGNNQKDVFFDVNAYFFFFYVLLFLQYFKRREDFLLVAQIFLANLSVLALKSLFFLYAFSHLLLPHIRFLYRWTRDFRLGEIVRLGDTDFHRIFFQHQIFAVLGFVILLAILIFYVEIKKQKKLFYGLHFFLALNLAVITLSFSRSFWAGLLLSGAVGLVYFIWVTKKRILPYVKNLVSLLVVACLAAGFLYGAVKFPYPAAGQVGLDVFKQRLNFISEPAAASRWNLLPELLKAITKHPVVGSGFGALVSYQTKDPRILNEFNPQGWYNTYAFEWGYLDIMLKIGLLGLFLYGRLLYRLLKQSINIYRNFVEPFEKSLQLGLIFALICLLCIHMFTPYLNHPLGIVYVLLLSSWNNVCSKQTV